MGRLSIALVAPAIPNNTGAIGRTCLAFGASLHVIAPVFDLSDARVKRAGLDYWKHVDLHTYASWAEFESKSLPLLGTPCFITKFGTKSLLETDFTAIDEDLCLVFGSETTGLTTLNPEYLDRQPHRLTLPMYSSHIRSLNLANCVSVVLYEALRQGINHRS